MLGRRQFILFNGYAFFWLKKAHPLNKVLLAEEGASVELGKLFSRYRDFGS